MNLDLLCFHKNIPSTPHITDSRSILKYLLENERFRMQTKAFIYQFLQKKPYLASFEKESKIYFNKNHALELLNEKKEKEAVEYINAFLDEPIIGNTNLEQTIRRHFQLQLNKSHVFCVYNMYAKMIYEYAQSLETENILASSPSSSIPELDMNENYDEDLIEINSIDQDDPTIERDYIAIQDVPTTIDIQVISTNLKNIRSVIYHPEAKILLLTSMNRTVCGITWNGPFKMMQRVQINCRGDPIDAICEYNPIVTTSAKNSLFAVGIGNVIRIFQLRSNDQVLRERSAAFLLPRNIIIVSIEFYPCDLNYIIVASQNKVVSIYRFGDPNAYLTLTCVDIIAGMSVTSVYSDQKEARIAVISNIGTLKIWEVKLESQTHVVYTVITNNFKQYKGHQYDYRFLPNIQFHPRDHNKLFVVTSHVIYLYDIETKETVGRAVQSIIAAKLNCDGSRVFGVSFGPKSQIFVLNYNDFVPLYSVGKTPISYVDNITPITRKSTSVFATSLVTSPIDPNQCVIGMSDGTLCIVNA
jgi:WD40 repeat protein